METNKKTLDSNAMDTPSVVVPAWEFLVLVASMVTVFGLSSSSSLNSLPKSTVHSTVEQQLERDPYDIQPARKLSDARSLVEVGL